MATTPPTALTSHELAAWRGLLEVHARVTQQLEHHDDQTSVTFLSLACSGAAISAVVSGGYGGIVNPGLPVPVFLPQNQNNFYANAGTATTPNFSAGGILSLHIDGYGNPDLTFDTVG